MKRYLSYVGIIFLIQVGSFWVIAEYSLGFDSVTAIFDLLYAKPSAFVLGTRPVWWLTVSSMLLIALIYSLVVASVIWVITYKLKMRREIG